MKNKHRWAVYLGILILGLISYDALDAKYKFKPVQSTVARDLPVVQVSTPQLPSPPLLDGFEDGLKDFWYREMHGEAYAGGVSELYASEGKSSYRIELRKSAPSLHEGMRSEIVMIKPEKPLEEHTYSFDVLLPKGGIEDYALDPKGSEIIATWINNPDPGEEGTTPPLALRTFNGRYILEQCWDDAEITSSEQMTKNGYRTTYDLGPYESDKGKFVSWSFHIKWGWLTSQNPALQVFKDDKMILGLSGFPNTTNDKQGIRLKLGISKWDWLQDKNNNYSILDKRVIYFDNVRIQ